VARCPSHKKRLPSPKRGEWVVETQEHPGAFEGYLFKPVVFLDGIMITMNEKISLIKAQAAATATSAAQILGLLFEPATA
jgi:hypothetical protein